MAQNRRIASELSPENYRRVAIINLMMSVPLFSLFAWIGFNLSYYLLPDGLLGLLFSSFFAFPMMLTLLHGHVTIAIGVIQRDHYYAWLMQEGNRLGMLFHPQFVSTKFRISGLIIYALSQFILYFY